MVTVSAFFEKRRRVLNKHSLYTILVNKDREIDRYRLVAEINFFYDFNGAVIFSTPQTGKRWNGWVCCES